MNNNNQIIVLGTGTSTGVPIVGCHCKVCQSTDPKDKRFRSSIIIKTKGGKTILVDATPDLRSQLLQNNITQIDATIITHDHADHIHGIDDLRPLCFWQKQAIPVFTNQQTVKNLKVRFDYIFGEKTNPHLGGGIPKLKLHTIATQEPVKILDEEFYFNELPHGMTKTLSLVHSKMAYIIDCNAVDQDYINLLKDKKLDLLIIDCVKRDPHDTHLNLKRALGYIKKINPKLAGLTHLGHDFNHQALTLELRELGLENVVPLFDGQILHYQ